MASDIIFVGPPGSGKGTVGTIIEQAGLARHLSTGEMIREFLKTLPESDALHAEIAAGHYLSDDNITAILVRHIERAGTQRLVLDGYPRNIYQTELLTKIEKRYNRTLMAVISFEMADARVVERISGRYNCRTCGHVYHRIFNPAPNDTCLCGETQFVVRTDDHPQVVEERLYRYHTKVGPVIEHYRAQGLLKTVNADQSIQSVSNAVLDLIS